MATFAGSGTSLMQAPPIAGRSRSFLRYIRRNPSLGVGLVILAALILFSTVGTLFIERRKDPYPLAAPSSRPPSWQYPFGTDAQGRNLLAVMIVGTQLSLRVGLMAGTIGLAVGVILAFLGAYYGGVVDAIIRWIVDVMLTIPAFLILIVIASTLRRFITIESMALIIASLAWVGPTRVIRSQVLSLRERPFVMMARLSGMSGPEIIVRELMPNLIPFLLASFVGAVTAAVYTAMGLELLGLGSQREPTLGLTLLRTQQYSAMLRGLWWWWLEPVLAILLLFIGLGLVSFGMDEWANPRTRRAA